MTALGHRRGVFYYRTAEGELYAHTARDHTARGVLALMGGKTHWLYDQHARRNAQGAVTGWNDITAAAALMRQCTAAGFFNPERQVRGPGVLVPRPGADGEPVPALVVHAGDGLWLADGGAGAWRTSGTKVGEIFYAASPPEWRPADTPLSAAEVHEILDHLLRWTWRRLNTAAPVNER